jgi:N-carbamoyl-L-amino-acid hydrolase
LSTAASIDMERLQQHLVELGGIGRDPRGGITRPFGSAAELAARRWLMAKMEAYGLTVRVDGAGNVWGHLPGTAPNLPPVVLGSHIDTVPNGGMYDGALGVLVGLEVARAIQRRGPRPRGLAVVAFTGEEPNPFGLSTVGSRALAGLLPPDALERRDATGLSLTEALARAGAVGTVADARLSPGALHGYFEVHIEQGARLDRLGLPVAVVKGIAGIDRHRVTLVGEANHAGTTAMADRRDALAGAAEVILAVEGLRHLDPDLVATVGQISVEPGAVNIIPGEVVLTAEVRAPRREVLEAARSQLGARVAATAARRGLDAGMAPVLTQEPVALDAGLQRLLLECARDLGVAVPELYSMAGHDAAHVARVAPAAMLFVRSVGGKSHCPEEESRLEDIEVAADVLLRAVLRRQEEDGL